MRRIVSGIEGGRFTPQLTMVVCHLIVGDDESPTCRAKGGGDESPNEPEPVIVHAWGSHPPAVEHLGFRAEVS